MCIRVFLSVPFVPVLMVCMTGACGGKIVSTSSREALLVEGLSVRDVGEYAGVPWGESGKAIEPSSRMDRVRNRSRNFFSVNFILL